MRFEGRVEVLVYVCRRKGFEREEKSNRQICRIEISRAE